MPEFRDIPEAIQWYEGMLLSPQHFQQASVRQEGLVNYHAQLISPYHYGIRRLKLDTVLLQNGTFRIQEVEAVMPDGTVVAHSAEGQETLELDLTESVGLMGTEPATVHLAIPIRQREATTGEIPRYQMVPGDLVPDENTGEGMLSIPRLRPRLALLLTEKSSKKPPAQYVTIPLAKVTFQNDRFDLTDYLPPQLVVPADSAIGILCSATAKVLREKAVKLAERALSPSLTMGSPLMVETRTQVASLVSALPQYEAMLETGVSHPYPLYLALCTLLGTVANLGTELVPPALPPYNHNDLRTTFQTAIDHIDRMLKQGIQEAYSAYSFHEESPGDFRLGFIWTWMARRLLLAVRGHQGMSESAVLDWVENCLIGSRNKIPMLRDNRILGAQRDRIERDDELIPARGVLLFELKAEPQFIEAGEVLQALAGRDRPDLSHPAEVVLYVKND